MATEEEVPKFSGQHNNGHAPLQSIPNHLPSRNPSSINPDKNHPTKPLTFNGNGQHRPASKNERAMEKFRDVVMKIAKISESNTTPTVAAAQKTLIEQRLTEFFSDFHTPNHPPYAAMVQRAIQELDEKEGSSEESISNYIKKEYNDLPWAHCTLLKHHLSKLCEYGEISMNRKQCYLLAGAKPCSNSCARPKRENVKRKRRSQSGRGRSRCRKKEETEEYDLQNAKQHSGVIEKDEIIQKLNEPSKEKVKNVEEQILALELPNEVIEEQTECYHLQNEVILDLVEQENPVMQDEAHELENGLIDGKSRQQNQESEAQSELPNETIEEQSECHQQQNEMILDLVEQENPVMQDEARELENGLIEGKSWQQNQESEAQSELPNEMTEEQSECYQQQNEVILEPVEQESAVMLDEACELENGLIEGKSRQQNQESEAQSELPNEMIEEQSECYQQQNEVILEPVEQESAVMLDEACELENGLIDGKIRQQNQESGAQQSQPWCPTLPFATLDLYPMPIQQQRPELSNRETAKEFEEVMVEQLSETDNLFQSLHEPKQAATSTQELLPSSESPDKPLLQTELLLNPERTEELKQTLENNEVLEHEAQEPEKSLIQGQRRQQKEDSGVFDELSPPHPEGLAKLGGLPESEPTLEKALTLPLNVDLLEKEQDEELPNSETELVAESKEVESLNRQKQQALRDKFQPEGIGKQDVPINSQPGTVVSCIDLLMNPKKIDEEQQSDISFTERPTELEHITVKQSCKTDRQQRQLKRWGKSLHEDKQTPTSMLSHSQDQHAVQAKEPNTERPEGLKETLMVNEVIEDKAHVLENSPIEGKSQQQKQERAQSQPNAVMPSEPELTAVTELSPVLHQMREDQQSKRQLQSQGQSHSVHKLATFVELRQPELSSPKKSEEIKLATINSLSQAHVFGGHEAEGAEPGAIIAFSEQSSHTDRGKRQLRRWTRNLHGPKQAGTSKGGLFSSHSHDEHSIQTELQNPERPEELKENLWEQSTKDTVQRAKLRSWHKQNMSHLNAVLDSALPPEQLELQPKPDLSHPERSAELEPEELSLHQKVTQNKSLQRRLRPRPPKSDSKPSDHHHEEEQPVHVDQEQPPEQKSDTPVWELTRADHQNPCVQEQSIHRGHGRGRGRPPKQKPDTPVEELTGTDHQKPCVLEEPAHRGRGRPPKRKPDTPVEELTGIDHQNPCLQEEPAHCGRGRGRPPKPKPDTLVGELTRTDLQNPCMQEELAPHVRGRGRPKRSRGKP
ncbi:hypothetical protein LguiB_025211 [Lonicera macranthoides]